MFEQYFTARLKSLQALSEAVVHGHHGLAGSAREMLVAEFLSAHLPPSLATGSGQVFGHRWSKGELNDLSRQQDIIIYRHDLPVLRIGSNPLYFAESVVATIEVRTKFGVGDLEDLIDLASSAKKVSIASTSTLQMGKQGPSHRSIPRRILTGVFFFSGPSERKGLVQTLNEILFKFSGRGRENQSLGQVRAPDFFYSIEAGLIVRNGEFNTLNGDDITGLDDVYSGLDPTETKPGAFRRVFSDDKKQWRGLNVLALELAERCQRYAVSYADLSSYV